MKILWICGPQASGKTWLGWDIYENHDAYQSLNDEGFGVEKMVKIASEWQNSGIVVTQEKPTTAQLQPLSKKGFTVQVIECCCVITRKGGQGC